MRSSGLPVVWTCTLLPLLCPAHTFCQTDSLRLDMVLDSGAFYSDGIRVVLPKHTTPGLEHRDTVTTTIAVRADGEGRFAVETVCRSWIDGGWIAAVQVPCSATCSLDIVTGHHWSCTDRTPVDSSWRTEPVTPGLWVTPGDYGYLADDTGGNASPVYIELGLELARLYYSGAHWISTPRTCYVRKRFHHQGGPVVFAIESYRMTHRVYIDTVWAGDRLLADSMDAPLWLSDPVVLDSGEHLLAMQATRFDADGTGAYFRAGILGQSDSVFSDSTWHCTVVRVPGWTRDTVDDSQWPTGAVVSAPVTPTGPLASAVCLWPWHMYYTALYQDQGMPCYSYCPPQAVTSHSVVRCTQRSSDAVHYSLLGQRLGAAPGGRRSLHVVVERTDGTLARLRVVGERSVR